MRNPQLFFSANVVIVGIKENEVDGIGNTVWI
jgi:hypothetical protein